MKRRWVALIVVALSAFIEMSALAASLELKRDARLLLNEGIDALKAGRFEEAIGALEKAKPLALRSGDRETIGACHRALAKAYDGLEDYDNAAVHYHAYLEVGLDQPTERREVQERVAVLARMERVTLTVRVDAREAALWVDGRWLAPVGEPVRVSPGRRTIRVTAPGYHDHEEVVELVVGPPVVREIRLRPLAPAARAPGDPEPAESGGVGAWPWVSLALGGVAGGVAAWLVADGNADWQRVHDASGTDPPELTKDEADTLVKDGDRKRTAGFVMVGVAGLLVVTGIVLFVTEAGDSADAGGSGATVTPLLAPGTVGLGFGMTF